MSDNDKAAKGAFMLLMAALMVVGVAFLTHKVGWTVLSIPFSIFASRQMVSDD